MNVLRSSLKKMTHISRPVSPTFSTEGLLLTERGQGGFALPPGGGGGALGPGLEPSSPPCPAAFLELTSRHTAALACEESVFLT